MSHYGSDIRRGRLVATPLLRVAAVLGWLCASLAQTTVRDVVRSDFIDPASLLTDLRLLSADDMEGRAFGTAGGAKARTFVIDRFRAAGIKPLGDEYAQPVPAAGATARPGARRGANVVGVVAGTGEPRRYIILSAHYDHVGVRNGEVFNGADDNASGAAALAAIGGYFVQHPLASTLIVAAFDGEEEGLVGSRSFVRALPVDRAAIVIDVNADMIGRDPNNTLFVTGVARQPFLKPFIDRVIARAPVRLVIGHDTPPGSSDDWTRDSDHYAFMEAGIPALYFGVEDYDHLHRPTDDYETMTYGFYVRAVDTLVDVIREFDAGARDLAGRDTRPGR